MDYFNPRTPCGVRLEISSCPTSPWRFQSTHPVWGATEISSCPTSPWRFQSTHPVWGATTPGGGAARGPNISIHAPRVGCDLVLISSTKGGANFNPRTPCGVRPGHMWVLLHLSGISIHAPRVGCDRRCHAAAGRAGGFQSTHPVWGATSCLIPILSSLLNFNPRTPCGVRLLMTLLLMLRL